MSDKIERIKTVLAGGVGDRIPFSVWTHFPGIDLDPERLAQTTWDFVQTFGLDFVKSMPNGMFAVEDWGCVADYSEIPRGGVAKIARYAVVEPEDWTKLEVLDTTAGSYGRELSSLRRLIALSGAQTPIVATAFSPLTIAQKLAGPAFFTHLREHPGLVRQGLEVITQSTAAFARHCLDTGCAGIYLASQLSTHDSLEEREYAEFGVPYDLRILNAAGSTGWFNIIHIHGDNIMFELLKDYPVQGTSWHVWETAPTVSDFLASGTPAAIVGGLRRTMITQGRLDAIAEDVDRMLALTGGRRLFLSPGCVIRAPVDAQVLHFLKHTIEEAGKRLASRNAPTGL